MPKKSTKSKSKRMTLRQKHKILRKVKQHHKKLRKEERKKGPKKVKDPGLPSQWPYKEELIKEFAFKRAQILADEKRRKEERKAAAQARDAVMGDADKELMQLAALQAKASKKEAEFETRKRARLTEEFNSDKDNSRKAFFREFKRVVELSDVVIQVLDARDPLACRCPDVERYIRQTNPNKKIILLLNKMDLVPREAGEKWLKYFREELPTVAFKCSTQSQGSGLGQKKMPTKANNKAFKERQAAKEGASSSATDALQTSACLGAETLLQLLKNYTRNAGIKTAITVGVVGLPNVGKSSLINSLKRARVTAVGNTPGMTKAVQEVVLDKHIKLLDSPGVVFVNAENDAAAALRNCIKIERLQDPLGPVAEILKRVPAKQLMALYKIGAFKGPDDFLQLVALQRGKLRKGGTPDMPAAARVVLQDWNDGKIPYFTSPPAREVTGLEGAAIVSGWSAEFNADEVFANERSAVIAHLPSMDDDSKNFFEAPTAGAAAADMEGIDAADDDEEPSSSGDDAMDDGDDLIAAAAAALARREAAKAAGASSQAAALYDEAGQFNPHAARTERKRLKKVRASGDALPPPVKKAKSHGYGDVSDDGDFVFEDDKEGGSGSDDDGEEEESGEGEEDDDEMDS